MKFGILSLLILALAACANTKVVHYSAEANQVVKTERSCHIEVFYDQKPSQPFIIIGEIESHIKGNFFFGGKIQLTDEAYSELKEKACQLGGDAVLIDDYIESKAAEMTHVHVWAKVLQYKK